MNKIIGSETGPVKIMPVKAMEEWQVWIAVEFWEHEDTFRTAAEAEEYAATQARERHLHTCIVHVKIPAVGEPLPELSESS